MEQLNWTTLLLLAFFSLTTMADTPPPVCTSANTANRCVQRDGSSRFQIADPSAAQDAATKNYVDTHAVLGPVSSTNTAVALFNGITGRLLQNSSCTIDGSGNIATGGSLSASSINLSGGNIVGGTSEFSTYTLDTATSGCLFYAAGGGNDISCANFSSPDGLVLNMGGQRVVAMADPISGDDAATKNYVLANAGVPSSRTISTTAPLAGGGDLSINRTFTCNVASGSQPGCLSSADWSVFNGKQAALTLGNLTSGSTGVSIGSGTGAVVGSGTTVSVQTASGSQPGLLSAADWTTFNGKQAAGNYITALTSDVSASGPGSAAATVNSVGGSTAANVHAAELLANAATATPFTANAIVKRDASGWIDDLDPSFISIFKEDFLGYQSANSSGFLFNGDSAGTSSSYVPAGGATCPDNGHMGCASLGTGSTTTGRGAIYSGKVLVPGGGSFVLEWLMDLSALSNGTDTYTLLMGFCDVFSSNSTDCTTISPGYMQYTNSVNSGNLVLKAKNSSGTTTNSTTAMATGWHKFQIQINAAGTLSTFFMDGVSIGTVNASISTVASANVVMDIVKSAGTTPVTMNVDYVWLRWKPTTPR